MTDSRIDAARILLTELGIRPEQLITSGGLDREVPIFSEYLSRVEAAVSDGTRRAYGTYWNRIRKDWGSRRIDEPTAFEMRKLVETTQRQAVVRRGARSGRGAAENMVAALRCIYRYANLDGYITEQSNVAAKVSKPRRAASSRRALSHDQLRAIRDVAAATGNDPDLDSLILRLHIETACRRGGALGLRPDRLEREQCLVNLVEKGESWRWQPVSPSLMTALENHIRTRGGNSGATVLRYRDGRPITRRRYDHLWLRIGSHLPWVTEQNVSAHWLRHTTLTWVERNFGFAVARAYAGHLGPDSMHNSTITYVRASLEDVASALVVLTGERHPLADRDRLSSGRPFSPLSAPSAGGAA